MKEIIRRTSLLDITRNQARYFLLLNWNLEEAVFINNSGR